MRRLELSHCRQFLSVNSYLCMLCKLYLNYTLCILRSRNSCSRFHFQGSMEHRTVDNSYCLCKLCNPTCQHTYSTVGLLCLGNIPEGNFGRLRIFGISHILRLTRRIKCKMKRKGSNHYCKLCKLLENCTIYSQISVNCKENRMSPASRNL